MSYYVMPAIPMSMAAGLKKTPNFNTVRQTTAAGITSAVSLKPYPTWDFEFSMDHVQGQESDATSTVAEFMATFMATAGGAALFLFEDPQDSYVDATQFGIGDGSTQTFQLSRNIGGQIDIIQNLNGTPSIYVNSTLTSPSSISATGVVTFTSAPASAAVLTWTGSFYFLCRFAEDTVDATRSYTINSGIDQWDIQSIKFSSEFVATSTYGTISAPGGPGGGGGSSVIEEYVVKTANYALTSGDYTVAGNSTGPLAFVLPDASLGAVAGQEFVIVNINTGVITVTSHSGNIDGYTSVTIPLNGQSLGFVFDGTNYQIE